VQSIQDRRVIGVRVFPCFPTNAPSQTTSNLFNSAASTNSMILYFNQHSSATRSDPRRSPDEPLPRPVSLLRKFSPGETTE
jgi:hypothetical protein